MLILNKVLLLPSIKSLNNVLCNIDNNIQLNGCLYCDRIAIKHETYNNNEFNRMTIWRTKSLLDLLYYEFTNKQSIAELHYVINSDHLRINRLSVNDGYKHNKNYIPLQENDSNQLKKSLLTYTTFVARANNKNKIIKDVPIDLLLYEKCYEDLGFVTTSRRSITKPQWFEAELTLDP